jgi:hypothetical protein
MCDDAFIVSSACSRRLVVEQRSRKRRLIAVAGTSYAVAEPTTVVHTPKSLQVYILDVHTVDVHPLSWHSRPILCQFSMFEACLEAMGSTAAHMPPATAEHKCIHCK